jgi:hypothetical protein
MRESGGDKTMYAINPHIEWGQAFYYADSNNQDFRFSDKAIKDPESAIGATVIQAIVKAKTKATDAFYAFYNDQPPAPPGEKEFEFRENAHSKGLMAFTDKQGFWLVHSAVSFGEFIFWDGRQEVLMSNPGLLHPR